MSEENKEQQEIQKAVDVEEESAANGSSDLRKALMDYAKRFNGYKYFSASRIECLPDKDKKKSILLQQMYIVYLTRKQTEKDFMETFGNGKLIFIQAHTECPTLAEDGLFDQVSIDGHHIKTQIVGHFAIDEKDPEETNDEVSEKGMSYFYKDANGFFMDIGVNPDVPLKAWREKHTTLFKRPTRPPFTPCILVKQGRDENGKMKFGMIYGNPYHVTSAAEVGELLKHQAERNGAVPNEIPEPQGK